MPNDPPHSRFVAVKGHMGTLVIDTHADQPETMKCDHPKTFPKTERVGNGWYTATIHCEKCHLALESATKKSMSAAIEAARQKPEAPSRPTVED